MHLAGLLQAAWAELNALMNRHLTGPPPVRAELQRILRALDVSWANFEQAYITDLIGIEEKARLLIVEAVDHESRLQELEAINSRHQYKDVQRRLAGSIARLNSVANYSRKGRDDLGV